MTLINHPTGGTAPAPRFLVAALFPSHVNMARFSAARLRPAQDAMWEEPQQQQQNSIFLLVNSRNSLKKTVGQKRASLTNFAFPLKPTKPQQKDMFFRYPLLGGCFFFLGGGGGCFFHRITGQPPILEGVETLKNTARPHHQSCLIEQLYPRLPGGSASCASSL